MHARVCCRQVARPARPADVHDAIVHRARAVAGHARAIVHRFVGVSRDVLDSKLRGACALGLCSRVASPWQREQPPSVGEKRMAEARVDPVAAALRALFCC
jgi:hypothetical protein